MNRTTTQIKDHIVRKGASELVQAILEDGQFFKTENELIGWAEEQFDTDMLGQTPEAEEYGEVMDIMMSEVQDRVYEFFQQVQYGIFEKAFLVQKSLDHDTSI
jgi:predicted DCC family thiol-disulfide oxidoreductase YuxK